MATRLRGNEVFRRGLHTPKFDEAEKWKITEISEVTALCIWVVQMNGYGMISGVCPNLVGPLGSSVLPSVQSVGTIRARECGCTAISF